MGDDPRVFRNGRNVGIFLAPLWAAATVMNSHGFSGAAA